MLCDVMYHRLKRIGICGPRDYTVAMEWFMISTMDEQGSGTNHEPTLLGTDVSI
jgi:hypothetical protein